MGRSIVACCACAGPPPDAATKASTPGISKFKRFISKTPHAPMASPSSEADFQVDLCPPAGRGPCHLSEIRSGEVGYGIIPADEVERIRKVGAELHVSAFTEFEILVDRSGFRLHAESAQP